MSAINELREALAHTETAQFVTTMLRDISVIRLQSIRAAYEANQEYYDELHALTVLLQTYAAKKNIALPSVQKKRMVVAITANRRFYGTLNADVIAGLRKYVAENGECDCLVIGRAGKQMLERDSFDDVPVTYAAFEKDVPSRKEVHAIVHTLVPYSEVTVIHPGYENAFLQRMNIMDITHVPHTAPNAELPLLESIFEPDITEMLSFFSTQIRFVLFDRILLETEVALTGARLMRMQQARERAKEMVAAQRREIHKETRTQQSMLALASFASFRTTAI